MKRILNRHFGIFTFVISTISLAYYIVEICSH